MKTTQLIVRIAVILLFAGLTLFNPWSASAVLIPTDGMAASLVLGQPDFTSHMPGIPATQTGMFNPTGVAVDPLSGKVFVADFLHHRVLRFASVLELSNGTAAEGVLGQADFTQGAANRGGAAGANTLYLPQSVSLDSTGRLWVADVLNHRVLRFDNAANKPNGAAADGVLGQPDFAGHHEATTSSGMYLPDHLFVTPSGQLWVADMGNHRVLRFDGAASKPSGAAADGVLGQPDFTTRIPTTSQGGMQAPSGVFVDPGGNLWVADASHRTLRFDDAGAKANGAPADGVLGQVDFTSHQIGCSQNTLQGAYSVSGDPAGRIYVSDTGNHRVLIFENAAELANSANASFVLGQPDFTTCEGHAVGITAATLNEPIHSFYDPLSQVLWVADRYHNRVLMYGIPEIPHYSMVYLPAVLR